MENFNIELLQNAQNIIKAVIWLVISCALVNGLLNLLFPPDEIFYRNAIDYENDFDTE